MRGTPRARLCLAISIALHLVSYDPARAQDTLSFSRVDISAGASHWVQSGLVDRFWRTGPGIRVAALTPYGKGVVHFALEVGRHPARSLELPSFVSVSPSLEWGLVRALPLGLHAYGGGGLGAYLMSFAERSNGKELELAWTGTLRLGRAIPGGWTVGTGVNLRRIMLRDPVNQTALFLEVGRMTRAPELARRALLGSQPSSDPVATDGTDGGGGDERGELPAPPAAPGNEGADVRAPGVSRLSDVFLSLPRWDRTTLDYRTSWAAPEGLAPFDDAAADLLLDGIPVPLDLFGSQALDRVPVSPEEIESLQAPDTPGLHAHRFRARGLLRIDTRFPTSEGFAVWAEGTAENATGDPGPFLFTDSTARNVDKLGTSYGVGAGGRRGRFSTSAGFQYHSDFLTDAGLDDRPISQRDPFAHYPIIRTFAPWASARFQGETTRHVLRAGRSIRMDYLFLPVVGFEVPTEIRFWHVGAAGETRLGQTLGASYQAYSSSDDLIDTPNSADVAFDLHRAQRGVAVEIAHDGALRLSLGAGIDGDRIRSRFMASPNARTTVHAQGSALAALGGTRLGVEGEVRRVESQLAGDFAFTGTVALARGSARWTVWRSIRAPEEQRGFWGLYERGYELLESIEVSVEELGLAKASRETGAHLELEWLAARSRLRVTPFLRATRTSGLTLARQSFTQSGPRPENDGPVQLERSAEGSLLTSGVEVRWTPGDDVSLEARYRWLAPVDGDSFFRSASGTSPTHRYWQRITWSVRPDLRLALGIEARGSTSWPAYARMGRARLPGSLVTDLSLEKTLWDGRARLCARIADLTDQRRSLHPLGATPGLSFALCGAVRTGR